MSNLDFWKSVEKTDPKHTKQAKVGGQMRTAVDAQYKKMLITKAFGIYGKSWGVVADSERFERIHYENSTCILQYIANAFYVHDGDLCQFPIAAGIKEAYMTLGATPYLKIDDEAIKKVRTDALTKGFTELGFCADIHMGKFDDQDYVEGAKIASQIAEEDQYELAVKEAMDSIRKYFKEQKEALATVKNDKQFEMAVNRVKEKITIRCKAANVSPAKLVNELEKMIEDRNNASK